MNVVIPGMTGTPDRLKKSLIVKVKGKTDTPLRRLYLDCSPLVAQHFKKREGADLVRMQVPENRSEYRYRFDAEDGIPQDVATMVTLLKEVLTVPIPKHVDLAVALDWHKLPPDEHSSEWTFTAAGELARKKYLDMGHSWRNETVPVVGHRLRNVVDRHPLFGASTAVLSVPGSSGNYDSFGEQVAENVAARLGKPFVLTKCRGPRAQKKANPDLDLSGEFIVDTKLSGAVIIVDDLMQSGSSIGVVALAARMAGAEAVYALPITKTHKR